MARRLLINIDHIATLRNARGEGRPSVLDAAKVCLENGAEGIVFHLREDRRHIKDFDVNQLKQSLNTFLDFEMGATNEMLKICADTKPNLSTLVPESRQELTTEGGLNMERLFVDFQKRVVPVYRGKLSCGHFKKNVDGKFFRRIVHALCYVRRTRTFQWLRFGKPRRSLRR